jgi:hypothetical protein
MSAEPKFLNLSIAADRVALQVNAVGPVLPLVVARPVSFERFLDLINRFGEYEVHTPDSQEAVKAVLGINNSTLFSTVDEFVVEWLPADDSHTFSDGYVLFRIMKNYGSWPNSEVVGPSLKDLKDAVSSML